MQTLRISRNSISIFSYLPMFSDPVIHLVVYLVRKLIFAFFFGGGETTASLCKTQLTPCHTTTSPNPYA